MPHTLLTIGFTDGLPAGLDAEFTVIPPPTLDGLVRYGVLQRPALMLVDGRIADWRDWVTTVKTSPATRRALVAVVIAREQFPAALDAGANAALAPEMLTLAALRELVPPPNAELAEQLTCGCTDPLPELAQQALERFNAREFYAQHDLFEALWMQTEAPIRQLYQGVLQVGVAYYQVQRHNRRGATKMLLRALQWLEPLPNVCQGIDVAQLRADALTVLDALDTLPADAEWDETLLKPVITQ
ncbi:MAG: DUF309 domain-containing protein [Phototrophicaceae bacterium]